MPFQGYYFFYAKFEDSNFSRFRDKKEDAKRKNRSDLGRFGSIRVISNVTIRCSAHDYLFNFRRNSTRLLCGVFEIYSELSVKTLKVAIVYLEAHRVGFPPTSLASETSFYAIMRYCLRGDIRRNRRTYRRSQTYITLAQFLTVNKKNKVTP